MGGFISVTNAQIPAEDPMVQMPRPEFSTQGQEDPLAGHVTDTWNQFLTNMLAQLSATPTRVGIVQLVDQVGTIDPTDIGGASGAGLYSLRYYIRVTAVASVASSLQVSFGWTDHSVAQTFTASAVMGNTISDWQSGEVALLYADGAPITYSVAVSETGTGLTYELYVVLQTVQA